MKVKNLKWTWYAAGAAIISPFILILLIDPDWIGRLIGITIVYLGLPGVLLWFTFGPRKNLGSEGRTIWPKYITNRFGDQVYVGTRILLGLLAGVYFYLVTSPFLIDVASVVKGEAPLHGSGTVTEVDGSSVAGFISQNIVFSENIASISGRFHASYFLLGEIKSGNSYNFIYLPHTRTILEMKQK